MSSHIKCDDESPEELLVHFRELHQALKKIISESSQNRRQVLICEYLKKLVSADCVGLYLFDSVCRRFRFQGGTAEIDKRYAGGYLEIDEEAIQSFEKGGTLKALNNCEVLLETEDEIFDFGDRSLFVLPVNVFSTVKGLFLCEHEEMLEIDEPWRVELIELFLSHLSLFIEFFLEYNSLEKKTRSLQLLYEIGNQLNAIRNEEQLLESILTLIEKYMQVDRCSLMIIEPDGKTMRIKKAFGMTDVNTEKIKVRVGEGIAGFVAAGERPLLIKDIEAEPHLRSNINRKKVFRTNSLLSVPLIAKGKVIGVINVNNRKDGLSFSEADLDLLSKIGSEIAAVLQRSYIALQLKKAEELAKDVRRFIV